MAGGTDLLASMGQRLIAARRFVIGIRWLTGLQGVEATADGGLRIGAGTTLTDLEHHPLLAARFPTLKTAINAVASRHVRNMATLGGNLALPTRCWYTNQTEGWRERAPAASRRTRRPATCSRPATTASPPAAPTACRRSSPSTPASRCASVRGERTVPLADFYRDDGAHPTVLEPDELILAVHVPPCSDRTAFMKVTPREGIDFGLGTIAVAVAGSNRRVRRARIIVNALGSHPMPLRAAEAIIRDRD